MHARSGRWGGAGGGVRAGVREQASGREAGSAGIGGALEFSARGFSSAGLLDAHLRRGRDGDEGDDAEPLGGRLRGGGDEAQRDVREEHRAPRLGRERLPQPRPRGRHRRTPREGTRARGCPRARGRSRARGCGDERDERRRGSEQELLKPAGSSRLENLPSAARQHQFRALLNIRRLETTGEREQVLEHVLEQVLVSGTRFRYSSLCALLNAMRTPTPPPPSPFVRTRTRGSPPSASASRAR